MPYKFVVEARVGCDRWDTQCLEYTTYKSEWFEDIEVLKRVMRRFWLYDYNRYISNLGMMHRPEIYDENDKLIEYDKDFLSTE